MNNSEKKYNSLGYILAVAILETLINKDFSTSDTEPDETNEKPVKEDKACHGNCQNNCKSCGENNSEIDMEVVKNYCYNLSCCLTSVINDEFRYTGRIPKKILYCSNLVKNLEKALGIKNGE